MKSALIIGVNGQDGKLLYDFLLIPGAAHVFHLQHFEKTVGGVKLKRFAETRD